jgi:hypothetical protein
MGYRSEVCMTIYGETEQDMRDLKVMLDTAGIDLDKEWSPDSWGITEEFFSFHVHETKWYEAFPEVQAVMKVWKLAISLNETERKEGETERFSGILLRIGEDNTDIEEESFGDPWEHEPPYVNRYIEKPRSLALGSRLEIGKPMPEEAQA